MVCMYGYTRLSHATWHISHSGAHRLARCTPAPHPTTAAHPPINNVQCMQGQSMLPRAGASNSGSGSMSFCVSHGCPRTCVVESRIAEWGYILTLPSHHRHSAGLHACLITTCSMVRAGSECLGSRVWGWELTGYGAGELTEYGAGELTGYGAGGLTCSMVKRTAEFFASMPLNSPSKLSSMSSGNAAAWPNRPQPLMFQTTMPCLASCFVSPKYRGKIPTQTFVWICRPCISPPTLPPSHPPTNTCISTMSARCRTPEF